MYTSSYTKSHTDKFTTVQLYTGDDRKIKRLFYAIVHSRLMGQWCLKHVGFDYYTIIAIITNHTHLLV